MTNQPEKQDADDCVHSHPIPADEAQRYSPARDYDSEQDIARYVEIEASDETVLSAEKIRTDIVMGQRYDLWEVATDKNRWWVITNITNLYSQRHFPSLDYTLSFHIGLMARLMSRSKKVDEAEPDPFDEVSRRWDQAVERSESAIEIEEFQAVGMLLRECLLSLSEALRRLLPEAIPEQEPKAGDFKGWANLFFDHLCPGRGQKELRSYLKNIAEKTWALVSWLTHERSANRVFTSISTQAVDTLLGHIMQLAYKKKGGNLEACPNCVSRDVRNHYDISIPPDGAAYSTCGRCGWTDHPDAEDRAARNPAAH